jgi:antitoxin (DNA-binding transcriptional repressor) of toxin-antitoxin stability system
MNTVSIEEFRAHLDEYLADAAKKDLILTNMGKPWLVLRAISPEQDADSTGLTRSPEFWQMIRERRQQQGIPWEEARKELGLDEEGDGRD